MSSIDERVVRMEFDNKQFESGVSTTMSTLEKLNDALKFRNAASGFDDIQKASASLNFAPLNDSIWQVQQNFSFFGEFVRTVFDRISNSVIDLGSNIVREMTVAPLQAGFSEYELMMDSVKTIMASAGEREGKSLDDVMGYLDELNTYADKTIYSFSDMTSSIGKFTNAGVDLETAVKAIQGISNEAAVSGANANEASRAMYNFAQAISTGSVKLIDWKSIENANMATVEFKEQLLETAVELGTVEKTADGMYQVLSKNGQGSTMKGTISATQNFNDSLAYQWMTADVLTTTLGKYADETTEIGQKAFKAATEVRTFSQLIDTVKETLGSGWTKSFQYMIGDLEESKELWTAVNDEITSILDPIAQAREEMLKFWHDNGGRATAIQAISDAWEGVKAVVTTISDTFTAIFGQMTGEKLVAITEAVGDVARRFKEFVTSYSFLTRVEKIVGTFFTVIRKGLDILKKAAEYFSPLVKAVADFGGTLFEVVYRLSSFVSAIMNARDPLVAFKTNATYLKNTIGLVISGFENLIQSVLEFVGINIDVNPLSALYDVLSNFMSDILGSTELGKMPKLGSLFESFGEGFSSAFDFLSSGIGPALSKLPSVVSGIFSSIGETVVEWVPKIVEYLGSQEFRDALASGTLLAGGGFLASLIGLSHNVSDFVKKKTEIKGSQGFFSAISDLFGDMLKPFVDLASSTVKKFTGFLDDIGEHINGFQSLISPVKIVLIAISLGVMASSIQTLSDVEPEKAAHAIATLVVSLALLVGGINAITALVDVSALSSKVPLVMMGIAIALKLMASTVQGFREFNWNEIETGLLAVGVMLVEFGAFLRLASGAKINLRAVGAIIVVASAIKLLAGTVVTLSGINASAALSSVLFVGALAMELAAFMLAIDRIKVNLRVIVALGMVAASIKVLGDVVVTLSGINAGTALSSVLFVGALAMELAALMLAINGIKVNLRTVAALGVVTTAIKALGDVVVTLSGINTGTALSSVLFVGALAMELAALMLAISGIKVSLTAIAAMAVIAVVIKTLGDIVTDLSGMNTDSVFGSVIAMALALGVLTVSLMALGKGSPMMLVGAAALYVTVQALTMFMTMLQDISSKIDDFGHVLKTIGIVVAAMAGLAVGIAVLGIVSPFVAVLAVAVGLFAGAITVLTAALAAFPVAVAAFAGSIAVITASSVSIATAVSTIITGVVVGLVKGITEGIAAIFNGISEILTALGGAIHAIGDFIVGNIPYVLSVVGTLVLSVLELLPTFIPQLVGVVVQFVVALIQTIVTWLPVIASALVTGVVTLINAVANGIRDNTEPILAAIGNILSAIIELVLTALADIVRLIPGVGDMFADGIEDAKDIIREKLAPDSFKEMTSDAMAGAAEGVSDGGQDLVDAAGQTGTETVDALLTSLIGGDASGAAKQLVSTAAPGLATGVPLTDAQAQRMVDQFNTTIGNGDASDVAEALGLTAVGGLGSVESLFTKNGQLDVNAFKTPIRNGDASSDGSHLASTGASGASSQNPLYSDAASGAKSAYTGTLDRSSAFSSGQTLPQTGASGAASQDDLYSSAAGGGAWAYGNKLGSSSAYSAGQGLPRSAAQGANDDAWRLEGSGVNGMLGYVRGMTSSYARSQAYSAGVSLVNASKSGIEWRAEIASPSKLTARLGNFVSQGFANGISALSGTVYKESVGVSQKAIDGLSGSIGVVSKYLSDDIDFEPTITPVMDLSEIQNGVSQLNRLVNADASQPLIGVGIGAYPQMMMSAMGGSQSAGLFGYGTSSIEETIYNIYVDGDLLATDERLKGAFDNFMLELTRKADM